MPSLRKGELKLMEKVWNREERAILWEAVGNNPALFDTAGKERYAEKQRRRAANRALEGKTALGGWEDSKKAIEEAEEQIEVEGMAAMLDQTGISPKQPWTEEVVDRTKE
jgi:hypothetical protein